jgi:membrane protein implicated in regulation of membrane protease activity
MIAGDYKEYSLGHFIKIGRRYNYTCEGCGAEARIHTPGSLVVHTALLIAGAFVLWGSNLATWLQALVAVGLMFLTIELVRDVVSRVQHEPIA